MLLQNTSKIFKLALGIGIVLFSFTIAANPVVDHQTFHSEKTVADPKLSHLVQTLYPNCYQEILAIYQAVGLTPLIEAKLQARPKDQALTVLNDILQAILLRPKDLQRYQLKDDMYLALVKKRLQAAYTEADLKISPKIERERLRTLLNQPMLWEQPLNDQRKDFNAVILLGSSYHDYLNRQNFFFDLLKTKKINPILNEKGEFPVYLLGGDRPLNSEIDGPIMDTLKTKNLAQNEQNMMNALFERAVNDPHNASLGVKLQPVATNAPKEAGGRPTTAGTIQALLPLLQNEKRVLVISTPPFIRYQKLVTQRQFLKQGLTLDIVAAGPSLRSEMEAHPKLAETSFLAICLDTLARELYELKLISDLKK